jgi:glycosyltransferase involved in cell wall biosynthesis
LPANISVRYHGDVPPPDVPSALESAHIAMLPSKSENFGHSIFEAFTAGKPVVTSHYTPWNGLRDRQAGMNVSINTAEELATAISLFARMDQETYDTWSLSARDFALASIDLGSIEAGYERMFSGNAV